MERWILDTDCGIDDAQAVFLALKHLDLAAITTCGGNTSASNAARNTSIICGIKQKEVPIYVGATRGILKPAKHIGDIHGEDGFGNMAEKYEEHANASLI